MFKLDSRFRWMLVLLTFAAYGPTLKLGFMWDDHVMIESNSHLRQWSLAELRHDFTTDVFDGHGDPYYRPAQTLLNRIDYTFWKLHPFGYHLTNFLGHVLNVLLVVELGLLLGLTPMGAFLAGTLIAVHPIVVEQLMIIAGRGEIFGLLTLLLSLYFFLQKDRKKVFVGYVFFILALFFKESAVVIPVLLALCFWHNRFTLPTAIKRIAPCVGLMLPYLWLRHNAVGSLMLAHDPKFIAQFFVMGFPHVLGIYLRLFVCPWNLHSHHGMPPMSVFWPTYVLLCAALMGYLIYKKSRWGLFATLWFLICLLPKTPVMIYGNFMIEHWAYPAYVGLFFLVGHYFAKAWDNQAHPVSKPAILGYLILLIFWALLVHLNVALRGTDETMYRWALHFTTSNPIRYNLGVELMRTGRPVEAATYFEEVRSHYPDDMANLHALALAYWQSGHRKAGYYLLKRACQIHPDYPPATQSLQKMKEDLTTNN